MIKELWADTGVGTRIARFLHANARVKNICIRTRAGACSKRGFTLVEVVIVVAIIIVLAAMALPDVIRSTQNQPLVQLTEEIINRIGHARGQASNEFRAYGIQISAGGADRGQLSVHQNANGPACQGIDWNVDNAVGEPIDLETRWNDKTDAADLHMAAVIPNSVSKLCFTPDGRTINPETNDVTSPDAGSGLRRGEFALALHRREDDSSVVIGFQHFVVVPYGGMPRWVAGEDLNTALAEGSGGI